MPASSVTSLVSRAVPRREGREASLSWPGAGRREAPGSALLSSPVPLARPRTALSDRDREPWTLPFPAAPEELHSSRHATLGLSMPPRRAVRGGRRLPQEILRHPVERAETEPTGQQGTWRVGGGTPGFSPRALRRWLAEVGITVPSPGRPIGMMGDRAGTRLGPLPCGRASLARRNSSRLNTSLYV